MKITEYSVKNPVTGVMVFLALALLGGFTFTRLKLDMLPNIEFPMVAVITQYQGAGPESVEQLVTRPIEAALASVKNVEDVTSTSQQGVSLVMVKLAWGSNMQQAEQEVRKNLEIYAKDLLPDDASTPLSFAFDPSMQPVMMLTVNAPGSAENARKVAEDVIEPYLTRIPGVASAQVLGGSKRQIQVRLLPEWLEAYRIPVAQIIGALRGSSVIIPGGSLTQGGQELNIATRAEFNNVDEIRDVVVGNSGPVAVRLRDVADVVDGFEETNSVVRVNDAAAVMMMVRRQSDANTVQVCRRITAELARLERQLPEGTRLIPVFDQGEPITMSISNLASSAWLAILLTAVVLFAFLRSWRTSVIVLVSIPLSLLATFAVMDFQKVTLNVISMAGLALAVGMLVDNSIVVLENIFSHLERGEDPRTAAIVGTDEVAMPIVASTLTTVVVFAPILFVPGLAGQLFKDMSLTICFSLLASLLIALTLVPLMASLMVRKHRPSLLMRFLGKLTGWLDPLGERYGRFLARTLRHRKKVFLVSLLLFAGSMALFGVVGIDFMAKADNGYVELTVKSAPGTSVAETDKLFREVEAVVKRDVPEARVVTSQFGAAEGIAALFGNSASSGSVQIKLARRRERQRGQLEIESVLRKNLAGLAGLDVRPANHAAMFGSAGDVVVSIYGDDLEALRAYGKRVRERLDAVPGAADVTFSMEEGVPELAVEVDREQIKLLGLTTAGVAATISTYFLGSTATVYREGGDEFSVFVRAPREVRADIERLRALPLVTPLGVTVPLSRVASIEPALGPTAIARENQRRMASISVTAEGIPLAELVARTEKALREVGPQAGITTSVGGSAEDLRDSFQALGLAFLAAVILVYMVMASQFESLLEPFVILFAVPLSLSGVAIALAISGTTLQVTALIGVILLAGVVVNNGIVLVDLLKVRRLAGEDLFTAAVDAGRHRLRPILMTTLTTVFGMIPLAFEIGDGAELWAPMARAVIGGMTGSTLLTLVLVPNLYVSLAGIADRRRARRQAKAAAQAAAAATASDARL